MQAGSFSGVLSGCQSNDYMVEGYIGSEGPYRLIVDTGSSTTALYSTLCDATCNSAAGYTSSDLYNPSLDTTPAVNQNRQVSALYGNGQSSTGYVGSVYQSGIQLSDGDSVAMRFVAISRQSGFSSVNNTCSVDSMGLPDYTHGIIGFGFTPSLLPSTDLYYHQYFAQNQSLSPEFTIEVCPVDDGHLWIGEYNSSYVASNWTCIPVQYPTTSTYWSVQGCGISLNGVRTSLSTLEGSDVSISTQSSLGTCNNGVNCPFVDSGTSSVVIAHTDYQTLVSTLDSDVYYSSFFPNGHPYEGSNQCYLPVLTVLGSNTNLSTIDALNTNLPTISISLGSGGLGQCDSANVEIFQFSAVDSYLSRYVVDGNTYYCAGYQDGGSFGNTYSATLGVAFLNFFTARHLPQHSPPLLCLGLSAGCPNSYVHPQLSDGSVDPYIYDYNSGSSTGVASLSAKADIALAIIIVVVIMLLLVLVLIALIVFCKCKATAGTTPARTAAAAPTNRVNVELV